LPAPAEYPAAFGEVAAFAPLLSQYFIDVFVMVEDQTVRESRLRLMRAISETCSTLARFDLLGG
jgi:glycyl-tRNA synthetase beta chain